MADRKKITESTSNTDVIGGTTKTNLQVQQDANGYYYYNLLGQRVPVIQGKSDPYFTFQNSNQLDYSYVNYSPSNASFFYPELFDILDNLIFPQNVEIAANGTFITNANRGVYYLDAIKEKYVQYQYIYSANNSDEKAQLYYERINQITKRNDQLIYILKAIAIGTATNTAIISLSDYAVKNPIASKILRFIKTQSDSLSSFKSNVHFTEYEQNLEEQNAILNYFKRKELVKTLGIILAVVSVILLFIIILNRKK